MEAQATYAVNPARARKWKITFITLSCVVIFFYILGGALVGASLTCPINGIDCVDGTKYYAGCAMCAIASFTTIPWFVFLVLRFTSWYRGKVVVVTPANAPVQVTSEAKVPQHIISPVQTGPFCTTCERPVQGSFCGHCGTRQQ